MNESKKQRELHPVISLAYWPDGVGQVKVRLEKEVMAEHALKKAIEIAGTYDTHVMMAKIHSNKIRPRGRGGP